MPSSSSKSKGKGKDCRGRHQTQSKSHRSHHTSTVRQDEPGESSRQAHKDTSWGREDEPGQSSWQGDEDDYRYPREGQDFGPRWIATYEPRSDETSVDRGRHRHRAQEYEGYIAPSLSPPRPRPIDTMYGDAARASLELVQVRDRRAHAKNDWRQGREEAIRRGELEDSGCGCVIL